MELTSLPVRPTPAPTGTRSRFLKARTNLFDKPLIPRLVLEVNANQKIAVASYTPQFVSACGELMVPDLMTHVKARIVSETFVGVVMTCLVEFEDMVSKLHLMPHVLAERTILFRPGNAQVLEMCMLLSMLENLKNPTIIFLRSLVRRARFLYSKNLSHDASFLLHGIETLCATLVDVYKLDPQNKENFSSPLLMYKFYACLEEASEEARGLLKPIFLGSHKMDLGRPSRPETHHSVKFSMFYCSTLLTKHFDTASVVEVVKVTCLGGSPRAHIIS